MEPEARAFLKKVGQTILIAFLWLSINATAALVGDNAFIGNHIRLANVLFYAWFIFSIYLLLRIYKKMWGNTE